MGLKVLLMKRKTERDKGNSHDIISIHYFTPFSDLQDLQINVA